MEINDLGIQGETKSKLLAEREEILKMALESRDENDFIAKLIHGVSKSNLSDFKYDHVMDYLIKRAKVSKQSALADFRSRVRKTVDETEVAAIEYRNTTHGSMIAIKADALNGKPFFTVQEITTDVAANPDQAMSWVEDQVGSGYQFVFILSKEGWKLLGTDSGLPFSEAQISSFFSQDLLSSLWVSHQPMVQRQRRDFNTLKSKGLN